MPAGGSFRVYPNPAMDYVSFYCPEELGRNLEIKIFTLAGKPVARITAAVDSNSPGVTWDARRTGPGVYLYLICEKGIVLRKGKFCVVGR